jgi:hypothetical protein
VNHLQSHCSALKLKTESAPTLTSLLVECLDALLVLASRFLASSPSPSLLCGLVLTLAASAPIYRILLVRTYSRSRAWVTGYSLSLDAFRRDAVYVMFSVGFARLPSTVF